MRKEIIIHAGGEIVEFPEIRKGRYAKDFSWGFYCTLNRDQALKSALKNPHPVINLLNKWPMNG